MKNDSRTISASEINRYVYCHYQWYYERWYGRKKLSELYRERNAKYRHSNNRSSHFVRGQKFHEGYLFHYRIKKTRQIIREMILAAIIALCLYLFFHFK